MTCILFTDKKYVTRMRSSVFDLFKLIVIPVISLILNLVRSPVPNAVFIRTKSRNVAIKRGRKVDWNIS